MERLHKANLVIFDYSFVKMVELIKSNGVKAVDRNTNIMIFPSFVESVDIIG